MDGVDRAARRPSLKERLGLKGLGCCGPTWGIGPTAMSVIGDDDGDGGPESPDPVPVAEPCVPQSPGMNLAAALAAERQIRAALDLDIGVASRVSLMTLLEETDGCDGEVRRREEGESDSVCCVCMGRRKGAAFIPCGHTFCRVCSRELWVNRGSCPLCNRFIHEILDIY
ncbi:E3 ubiquitin-protein ligase COP1-like [Salvia splendens]|nr:E3 ubiquitin-protein ligase COP1-like [Salvia splendens]XP_042029244.1 E3 ubiquitin-protein ligase COP1-like [Salvia splendens]